MKENTLIRVKKTSTFQQNSPVLITEKKISEIKPTTQASPTITLASLDYTTIIVFGLIGIIVGRFVPRIWNKLSKSDVVLLSNSTKSKNMDTQLSDQEKEKIPTNEFAVDITATNVRTEDFYRADIQATAYVSISKEDRSIEKAIDFFGKGNKITSQAVKNTVNRRLESSVRAIVGQESLDDLHQKRGEVSKDIKDSLEKSLERVGLDINEIIIGNIEENENYSSNNYFDAKILEERTNTIQNAISKSKIKEFEVEKELREKELAIEKEIREIELNTEK